jgi:hypothetical protein
MGLTGGFTFLSERGNMWMITSKTSEKVNKLMCMMTAWLVAISLLLQGNVPTARAAEDADVSAAVVSSASVPPDPTLQVQMYNADRTEQTATLKPSFKVVNAGADSVLLENVKLRYYFTSDGSNVLSYRVDSSSPSIGNSIIATFAKLPQAQPDADYYMEIGFDEFAGTLGAGAHIALQVSINKNVAGHFTQSNDYSFHAAATAYADWNHATAYYGGALVWGDEVSGLAPPSENYALGKPVTASSAMTAEGWGVQHVTDGERRSMDASAIGWSSGEGHDQWLKIDLGTARTINRVDLHAINWLSGNRGRNGIVGEGYPVDFAIQVSADDSGWTTVVTETDVLRPTIASNSYAFDSVNARYVRIATSKNRPLTTISGTRAAFAEIEVYHDSSYVAPPPPPVVPSAGRAVITPAEFTGAIQNPLMGMATKDFRVNLAHEWPLDYMPWASLAMTYIPWDLLENDVSDTIDKIIQYSNERWRGQDDNGNWVSYEDYNMKVIPRVFLKFPDDPFFGLEGNHWPDDMAANNFTSDNFDKRLKRLIQRLGALWDNDPRVAYVQMGLYGLWGEQHGTSVPPNVEAYFHQYFPNKQVQVRYEGHDDYSFGQYNDSMGNMRTVKEWKQQAVGGEPAYDYNGLPLHGANPHLTMIQHYNNAANMIRNVHAAYLTWIGEYTYRVDPGYPGLPAYYENKEQLDLGAETIQKAFGYRYVITDFNYPQQVNPGEDFAVQFKVKNNGASPMYYNWPIQLSFKDPQSNEIVWSDTFDNVDIRDWLPGEGYTAWNNATNGNWSNSVLNYTTPPKEYTVADSFTLPSGLDQDKDYIIQLAVLDPAGNVPSLRFAIQNYKKGGYAPMGYVGVGQEPATITIDPAYFDNPAKDISLRYFTADRPSQAEPTRVSAVTIEGANPVVYVDSGAPFNLSKLMLKAEDQFGRAHNAMVGMPITWAVASGHSHAAITGNKLTPISEGQGTLTATLDGVTSSEFSFAVEQTSITGAITGQIKDNFGRMLQGVEVSVAADGEDYVGTTDAIGVYTIADVPVGTGYTVTAKKLGYEDTASSGVVVAGAQTATVNLTMPVTSAGHFSDDFSSGSGNWAPGTGTWTVSNGEYVQSGGSNSNSWKYSTSIKDKVWYDATYEVDLKSANGSSWASFMFRKKNQSDTANNTGYFVSATGTGEVKLQKAGSTVATLASVPGAMTNMTEYHHLKIVTEGTSIKVYVDHQTTPVIDINDSTYAAGYAGLGNGGATWHYDNVKVTTGGVVEPEPEPEPAGEAQASLTGPNEAYVGRELDLAVGLKSLSGSFSMMEVVVNYDPSKYAFATVEQAGKLKLAENALTMNAASVQVLGTAVKQASGQIYLILASPVEPVTEAGALFTLHGCIKEDAAAGELNVSLTDFEATFEGEGALVDTSDAELIIAVKLADKATLTSLIASAQQLYNSTSQGNAPGQYPQAARTIFHNAIEAAAAASAQENATQADIDAALAALQAAVSAYQFAVVPSPTVNKAALQNAITSAEGRLSRSAIGDKLGQYPQQAVDVLTEALTMAEGVNGSGAASQAEVDQAEQALGAALQSFAAQMVTLVPGTGKITIRDLSLIAKYYGVADDDVKWDEIRNADVIGNGRIDIVVLAAVAQMILDEWLLE